VEYMCNDCGDFVKHPSSGFSTDYSKWESREKNNKTCEHLRVTLVKTHLPWE
jgi:hypothetical protein